MLVLITADLAANYATRVNLVVIFVTLTGTDEAAAGKVNDVTLIKSFTAD